MSNKKILLNAAIVATSLAFSSIVHASTTDKTDAEIKAKCELILASEYPETTSKILYQKFEINQLQVMSVGATVLGFKKAIGYTCNVNGVLISTKRPVNNEKAKTFLSRHVLVISLNDIMSESKITRLPVFDVTSFSK
jgi:hypothetical protein